MRLNDTEWDERTVKVRAGEGRTDFYCNVKGRYGPWSQRISDVLIFRKIRNMKT